MNHNNLHELKKKILFTIVVLIFYRAGSFIPIPLIDLSKLASFAEMANKGIFSIFNKFSGGSISRASIFALGIMPYITASIIIQLVVATTPELKKMKKEGGEAVQEKFNQYTKYLAILVGFGQAQGLATILVSAGVVTFDIFQFKIIASITMLCGTFILIWLGERISKVGIGNGSSLIIFTGIVSEAPKDLMYLLNLAKNGNISPFALFGILLIFCATLSLIVLVEKSYRMVYIQYPRQAQQFAQMKNQMPNFLPLKLNAAGVIPPIFASSVILLPSTIASVFKSSSNPIVSFILANFTHGTMLYIGLSILLIVFFSFFYNSVVFDPEEISSQLKKSNIFIPGTRPGEATSSLLKSIMSRLSLIGALYLSVICSIPEVLSGHYGQSFLIGGTGLLIVVSVITDSFAAVQMHLLPNRYAKSSKKMYR